MKNLNDNSSAKRKRTFETFVHGIFLILGLVTVACVLLISIYLIVSGIPAIRQIGLVNFLFGKKWEPTAATPAFGILPFILTSIYGTAGAIILGVPIGFLASVYLAKAAKPKLRAVAESAVSLLAGIPSVVYGLVGMLVLVPGIRNAFNLADGSGLLAAIIVLAIMILPSIIKVSMLLKPFRRSMRMPLLLSVQRRRKHGSAFPFRQQKAVSLLRLCSASGVR